MVEMLMSQVLHGTAVDVNLEMVFGDGESAYGVRCPKKTKRIIARCVLNQSINN